MMKIVSCFAVNSSSKEYVFPDEIVLQILSFVDKRYLQVFAKVNTQWQRLTLRVAKEDLRSKVKKALCFNTYLQHIRFLIDLQYVNGWEELKEKEDIFNKLSEEFLKERENRSKRVRARLKEMARVKYLIKEPLTITDDFVDAIEEAAELTHKDDRQKVFQSIEEKCKVGFPGVLEEEFPLLNETLTKLMDSDKDSLPQPQIVKDFKEKMHEIRERATWDGSIIFFKKGVIWPPKI